MKAIPAASPRKVFLFSGHMIDAADRALPRFPAHKEAAARRAIARLLDDLGASPQDVAICGGACGGDLLFAEAALARGVALEMYLPFDESMFVSTSVGFAGGNWHARFLAARSACTLHVMPEECGPLPEGSDPYERNNLWMLRAASRFGAENIDFICLWDGLDGDGPGGTGHLMHQVSLCGGRTHWLDITQLRT